MKNKVWANGNGRRILPKHKTEILMTARISNWKFDEMKTFSLISFRLRDGFLLHFPLPFSLRLPYGGATFSVAFDFIVCKREHEFDWLNTYSCGKYAKVTKHLGHMTCECGLNREFDSDRFRVYDKVRRLDSTRLDSTVNYTYITWFLFWESRPCRSLSFLRPRSMHERRSWDVPCSSRSCMHYMSAAMWTSKRRALFAHTQIHRPRTVHALK